MPAKVLAMAFTWCVGFGVLVGLWVCWLAGM